MAGASTCAQPQTRRLIFRLRYRLNLVLYMTKTIPRHRRSKRRHLRPYSASKSPVTGTQLRLQPLGTYTHGVVGISVAAVYIQPRKAPSAIRQATAGSIVYAYPRPAQACAAATVFCVIRAHGPRGPRRSALQRRRRPRRGNHQMSCSSSVTALGAYLANDCLCNRVGSTPSRDARAFENPVVLRRRHGRRPGFAASLLDIIVLPCA